MLQDSSVIEQDKITLPHNNESSSTHNDEVLATANENNCELNESAVKHQLLPPCKCKRNCLLKINEDRRSAIHDQYWKLPYNYRRTWLHNHVKVRATKRLRKETKSPMKYLAPDCIFWKTKTTPRLLLIKFSFWTLLDTHVKK